MDNENKNKRNVNRANTKPRADKPTNGKKSFGKPTYAPKTDKPRFGDKPNGERTYAKKPYGDKPNGERTYAKKPYGDKPNGERTYSKKPYGDKPNGERTYAKKPYGDKPNGERTYAKKPYGDKPNGEHTYAKKPYGDKPNGERTYAKKPYGDKPKDTARRDEAPRAKFRTEDKPAAPRQTPKAQNGFDARRVALNALSDVNRVGSYASLALDKRLRECYLSPEDKRLATSIFYAAVENRLYIEYALSGFKKVPAEPIIEDILQIACAQILFLDRVPAHAAVDEAVKQTRVFGRDEASGFVNAVLRSLLRAIEADELKLPDTETEPSKYLSIKYSVPEHVIDMLTEAYGFETAAKIVSYRPSQRLETVRFNSLRTDANAFEAFMDKRGWTWRKSQVEGAYLVERAGNLATDPDFFDGLFTVQGESSMLAACAVEAKPGMTILDACAAPGGKSAVMCEMMRLTGRVHAWDVHEHRVELIKALAKRLRLDNIRPAVRDASVHREDLDGTLDAVLIDAPCSGLGVMVDKPDVKFKVTDESVKSLEVTQRDILNACCPYVKKGGLLVYSTCSILPRENEKQIEAFLLNHPEFKLDTDDKWLPDSLKHRFKGGMLSLIQSRDGVEGFFIARLRRTNL